MGKGWSPENLKNMARAVSEVELNRTETDDEYRSARIGSSHFAQFMRSALIDDGVQSDMNRGEMKEEFLDWLKNIDLEELPVSARQDFKKISDTAKDGDWNNNEFLENLNNYCIRFSKSKPIETEK